MGSVADSAETRDLLEEGQGSDTPGAGMFLLLAWLVLFPVGALIGAVPAWLLWRRQDGLAK